MGNMQTGKKAPDFCLPDENGKEVCLKDYLGKWIVLYFYPKDNTPGCTLEAIDFSKQLKSFEGTNAVIIGVSPDSLKSHCSFREKHDLKIILLSDEKHLALEQYGVWVLKKMYGREYFGVQRSTFLIDPEGNLIHQWLKVKVKGHVDAVKLQLQEFHKK